MYKKIRKYTKKTYDNKIALLCDQIIEQNPEVYFAVSKKFIENADGSFKFVDGEIKGKKVERLYLDLNYDMKSGEKNHVK